MFGPFEYEVTVWYSGDRKAEKRQGVTFADSYSEAVENVEDFYGEDMIDVKLFALEENKVYEFNSTTEEVWHGMYKIKNVEKWEEEVKQSGNFT